MIKQSHEPSIQYQTKEIENLLIHYIDDKHLKITINEDKSKSLLLFIGNIFTRPNFNDDIKSILKLDILGKREKYCEKTIILTKTGITNQPKIYKQIRRDSNIIFELPMLKITLDHKNRNITTQHKLGPKRYISFDSIATFNVTDLKLSITDNEGFDFILYERDLKEINDEDYIYYHKDLINIMNIIDLDIKSRIIKSLETLDLKPLSEIRKK